MSKKKDSTSRKSPANALVAVHKLADAKEELEKHQCFAAIFFSDLSDSTLYKFVNTSADSVAKTIVHNETISKVIIKYKGKVVKYIGDEVMATFVDEVDGQSPSERALLAALECHKAFENYNKKHKLKDLERYRTKTGIHCGMVIFFPFAGHAIPDPLGSTVDIAARLTSLAKPCQILCADEVKNACSLPEIEFADASLTELKGISEKVNVHEVFWDSSKVLGVAETEHFALPNKAVDRLVERAHDAWNRDDYDNVIVHCKDICDSHDSEHFVANAMLARTYLRERYDAEKAFLHAEIAKRSMPMSSAARNLYAAIGWYKAEVDDNTIELDELDVLIEEAKIALDLARQKLNGQSAFWARNSLAYYYALRFDLDADPKDLVVALEYCEDLEVEYSRIRRHQVAPFWETYAFVLSHKEDRASLVRALDFANRSEKENASSPFPDLTKAFIKKKVLRLGFRID